MSGILRNACMYPHQSHLWLNICI